MKLRSLRIIAALSAYLFPRAAGKESGQSRRAGGSHVASGSDYPDRDRAACAVTAEEIGHVAGRAVKVRPSTAVTGP